LAFRINTNVTSTFSARTLGGNWAKVKQSQERLSSGSRINHGADDAAGLSMSEKNKANLRSLAQAERNIQDGFGFMRTADGAFNEVGNILTRLRELSVQGASDTIGDTERGMVEKEFAQLKSEIDRIALTTRYNGLSLLDGSAKRIDIQVDAAADPQSSRVSIRPEDFDVRLSTLGLEDIGVTTKEASRGSLEALDDANILVSNARASVGALEHRLEACQQNVNIYRTNLSNTESRIRDTDMAEETSELVKNNLVTQANTSVLSQANQSPSTALKLMS
jgi:flagellin